MPAPSEHIDQPEPRGQTIAAVLAVGAIYLALPRNVVVGPIWLLPTVIVVLLVPTVVSHRVGKQSLNRLLGFVINGITTLALIVLCNLARPSIAVAPRISIAIAPVRRATLADECDRVRAVVLAPGRRRPNPSTETTEIRQQEFPLSTDANYA